MLLVALGISGRQVIALAHEAEIEVSASYEPVSRLTPATVRESRPETEVGPVPVRPLLRGMAITLSGPGICSAFVERSLATWTLLRDGAEANMPPREETLTELNLIALSNRSPLLFARKLSAAEEKREGADWQWWIGRPNKWVSLRIQAKKLDYVTLVYEALAWGVRGTKGKNARAQAEHLIDAASNDNSWPLYCFYNAWAHRDSPSFHWNCCTLSIVSELLGCALAPATRIYDWLQVADKTPLARTAMSAANVGRISWPWSCLVCCERGGNDVDIAERAARNLRIMFADDGTDRTRGGADRWRPPAEFQPRLPQYARLALPPPLIDLLDEPSSLVQELEPTDLGYVVVTIDELPDLRVR
jgi:hypothetical protein